MGNKKDFNLFDKLEQTIKSNNKTLHNMIKATPLEFFYSTNKSLIKIIKANVKMYYERNYKGNTELDLEIKI